MKKSHYLLVLLMLLGCYSSQESPQITDSFLFSLTESLLEMEDNIISPIQNDTYKKYVEDRIGPGHENWIDHNIADEKICWDKNKGKVDYPCQETVYFGSKKVKYFPVTYHWLSDTVFFCVFRGIQDQLGSTPLVSYDLGGNPIDNLNLGGVFGDWDSKIESKLGLDLRIKRTAFDFKYSNGTRFCDSTTLKYDYFQIMPNGIIEEIAPFE